MPHQSQAGFCRLPPITGWLLQASTNYRLASLGLHQSQAGFFSFPPITGWLLQSSTNRIIVSFSQ
jgi:hypothetical protein